MLIHPSYVDPLDVDDRADALDDARAELAAELAEAEYADAEHEGMRLDSVLCAECPDPGLCAAEGECPR